MEKYGPLREIRATHRFLAFEGQLDNRKVFIKQAVDTRLRERLLAEAAGLMAMSEIDPLETQYQVPGLIELNPEYIVTEWASGYPMEEDFTQNRQAAIAAHLPYLAALYSFIDQRSGDGHGMTRFNRPGKKANVKVALDALHELDFERHIDKSLVEQTAVYITRVLPETATRYTNGDLQPGNLLIDGEGVPTVVDCETCSWLWPRHYNIVNFVFNYAAKYPALAHNLRDMFREYCEHIGVVAEESIDAFNVSAAARCLQMVQEQLTAYGSETTTEKTLDPAVRAYVEATMGRITSGKLFSSSHS